MFAARRGRQSGGQRSTRGARAQIGLRRAWVAVRWQDEQAQRGTADVPPSVEVADDYMPKPFSLGELLMRAGRLIQRDLPDARVDLQTFSEADRGWLDRAVALLDLHLSASGYGVENLAKDMAVSRRHLLREIRRLTDQGAAEWMRTYRLQRAAQILERGTYATVSEVAAEVGMSPAYFSRAYTAWTGVPPSQVLTRSATDSLPDR